MNNANASNGGGGRRRRGNRKKKRSNSSSNAVMNTRNNQNYYENEHDEFIDSFQLNISAASSPTLIHNDIRKLGNGCYSAKMIRKYFENSNPHNVGMRIVQIWKVHNVRHYAQFMQNGYDEVDNMLLWHGTSRKNLISILQNSLKLPVQATHGHMFGPGIYFADRMSKSANYTDTNGPIVFLLCQVALGRKWRVFEAENFYYAPDDFDTLKAVGTYIPDVEGQEMLGEYCRIPCGRTIDHPDPSVWSSTALQYNEYIVFDQDRIRIKFIVHCKRTYSNAYVARAPAPVQAPAIPRNVTIVPRTTNNRGTTAITQNSTARPQPAPRATTTNTNTNTNTQNSAVRTNLSSGLPITQTYTVPSTYQISSGLGLGFFPNNNTSSPTQLQPQPSTVLPNSFGTPTNQTFSTPTTTTAAKNKKNETSCCTIL